VCALALWLCTSCDAGKPRTGTPGLEPPHGTEDASVPAAGQTGGTGTTSGGAGSGGPIVGTGGGSAAGAGGAGGQGTSGGGGAFGNAGSSGVMEPLDAGAADGGLSDGGALSFSELHAAELMKDCKETVSCFLQRDEQVEPDPLATCLEDSAALLDSDPALQASFLANVARCSAFLICDYYDCASMPQ